MEKIKLKITNWMVSETGKDILTVFIVILVGLGSFGLGRLSKAPGHEDLQIEYPKGGLEVSGSATAALAQVSNTQSGQFFASSKGSKYYPVGCSAGKTIKQETRVYFNTREQAETAGYELSGSCR